jgi:hypothetical protein
MPNEKQPDGDGRHALSQHEVWFMTECASIAAYLGTNIHEMEKEAKLLLARLAARL